MKRLIFIALITGLITLFGCDDEHGKNLLKLDTDLITLNHKDDVGKVQLTSGATWEVSGVPDWIQLSPESGDSSTEISITADENNTFEQRIAKLIFTNGHISKTLTVKQLSLQEADPFIELSEKELQVGLTTNEIHVELTTNRPWKIQNIPDWLSVAPVSGEKSALLTIRNIENRGLDSRSAQLTISAENVTSNLNVNQYGMKSLVASPYLPIFKFEKLGSTYKTQPQSTLISFNVKSDYMFINPAIKDKIYLGNLVCHNIGQGANIPEYTGYTFKPITVSTSAPIYSRTFQPSLAEQNNYAEYILSQNPKQILSFTGDNGTVEFYSYRQLHAVGMANLGIKLDEIVSGSSYAEKEMQDKYGLIFSFRYSLFSLNMDIPEDGTVIHEKLKESDESKGVSYISSVNYGKLGLLVVQSGIDSREVRIAINNLIQDKALSSDERALIESSEICYVYFDNNNQVKTVKGTINAVEAYKNAISPFSLDNIYPITFSVSDFATHAANTITYSEDLR